MIDHQENSPTINFMDRYSEYTYSDFFCEMSLGEFDFIGDEYHLEMPLSSEEYRIAGYNYSSLNNLVLQLMDSAIDYTRFDKWKFQGGIWVYDESGDGSTEMVIINYRSIPNNAVWGFIDNNPGAGGIATLGTTPYLDNKNIYGVTALGLLNRTTRTQLIVEHEISHRFFGHTSLGLMTRGHGQSSYQMSPHEREYIDYIQPTNVSYSSSSQSFILRDYIKYGDCLKIQIPNSSPAEYFYIANHQKKSKYDGLARGSNTCWETNNAEQDPYCDMNKGLFVYHSTGGCSNNHGREIDIENAEGKWNWQVDYTISVPVLGGTTPILSTTTGM